MTRPTKTKIVFLRKGTLLPRWHHKLNAEEPPRSQKDIERLFGNWGPEQLGSGPRVPHILQYDTWCLIPDDDPESNEWGEVSL